MTRCFQIENSSYLNHYLETLLKTGKKPGTVKQYTSDLTQFISWLDTHIEKGLLRIETIHIASYVEHLNEKKHSNATIKRQLSSINGLLAYYLINAEIPPEHVKTYRSSPLKQRDFISKKEMDELLTSMQRPTNSVAREELINRNLEFIVS